MSTWLCSRAHSDLHHAGHLCVLLPFLNDSAQILLIFLLLHVLLALLFFNLLPFFGLICSCLLHRIVELSRSCGPEAALISIVQRQVLLHVEHSRSPSVVKLIKLLVVSLSISVQKPSLLVLVVKPLLQLTLSSRFHLIVEKVLVVLLVLLESQLFLLGFILVPLYIIQGQSIINIQQ